MVPAAKLAPPALPLRQPSHRASSSTSLFRMATHSGMPLSIRRLTARAKPAFSLIPITRQPRARARSAAPSVDALSTTMISANGTVWRAMLSRRVASRSARLWMGMMAVNKLNCDCNESISSIGCAFGGIAGRYGRRRNMPDRKRFTSFPWRRVWISMSRNGSQRLTFCRLWRIRKLPKSS